MSSVALRPSKIESRICPRTRVEEGGAIWVFPQRELFSILECPGNRVPGAVHENCCGLADYDRCGGTLQGFGMLSDLEQSLTRGALRGGLALWQAREKPRPENCAGARGKRLRLRFYKSPTCSACVRWRFCSCYRERAAQQTFRPCQKFGMPLAGATI